MKKLYFPLTCLMDGVQDKHDTGDRDMTALHAYSRSLLENLSADTLCAVVHMDTILQEKFNFDSVVELLDTILRDPSTKLLEYDDGRRNTVQTYLLALRTCYIHDSRVAQESEYSFGFRQILATALSTRESKTDINAMNLALCALRCIAHELMLQEDFDAALALYNDILERQLMVLGEDHSDTMITTIGICDVTARQGHFQEAKIKFEQVIERKKQLLGHYHPETLTTLGAYAYFLTHNSS